MSEETILHDLAHIWPILQTVALVIIALIGFAIRPQLARVGGIEHVLRELTNTLQTLNVTLVKLEADYAGHVKLDEMRFAGIEHRLNAHRETLETLRGTKGVPD